MNNVDFEKQFEHISKKINELKKLSLEQDMDLSQEINLLEEKAQSLLETASTNLSVWQKVHMARHKERPTTSDYIHYLIDDFIELHGDRNFADDSAIIGGIGLFEGIPVTVIGHQKGKNTKENIHHRFGMPQPEGYRKALRLMEQANKFNRPIITLINTAGAYPGKEAEERGQSEAIARNLREMAGFGVPIICIVTGEGGSGGALALGVGNRTFMLENSFYSVISPEGAAALLWKDATKAQQAAETMRITAPDLLELNVIDGVIPEPIGGAHKDPQLQSDTMRTVIKETLALLSSMDVNEIIQDRYDKYRVIGKFSDI